MEKGETCTHPEFLGRGKNVIRSVLVSVGDNKPRTKASKTWEGISTKEMFWEGIPMWQRDVFGNKDGEIWCKSKAMK